MKFHVKIYMKSGNVIDEWFKTLKWERSAYSGKTLTYEMSEPGHQVIFIDIEEIEAIIQVGAQAQ